MSDVDLTVNSDEAVHRVILLGSGGVGKSALTLRFMYDEFQDVYTPTKSDSYRKKFVLDGRTHYVDILDTAGQENYASVRDAYLADGDGFMCVFSLTDNDSFNAVNELKDHILRAKGKARVPLVLVGNKADLKDQSRVRDSAVQSKVKEWDVAYFETSASTELNVNESFFELLRDIIFSKGDTIKMPLAKRMTKKKDVKCCRIL